MSNGSWGGGKGSNPRPIEDRKQFEYNWDLIFNHNIKVEKKKEDKSENK